MKMRQLVLLALAVISSLPADAAAQAPPSAPPKAAQPMKTPFQVAGGYTVADYTGSKVLPVGWFVSAAARPLKGLTIVGEVTGDYATTQIGLLRVRTDTYAFLNGLRVATKPEKPVRAFVETLVGVVHNREFRSETSGANRFAVQPGAGVDVALNTRVAIRFQGAARIPSGGAPAKTSFRYVTGIVVSGKGGP